MSRNNSEKEDKSQQENPKYINNIKETEGEVQKENRLESPLEENKKIFVKNIPFNTTDDQFKYFFSKLGKVEKAEIIRRDNGSSHGVGFVEFTTVEEKNKILSMNREDFTIDGRRLDVREVKPERNMDFSKTLYVGNISYDSTEEILKKFFIEYCQNFKGDFKVNIQTNSFNGKPKGYAYIEFENEEDLSTALKANGQELDKRILIVKMIRTHENGSDSKGRRRGRFKGGIGRRGYGYRRYDHGRDGDYYYRDRSRHRSRSYDKRRGRERSRDNERYKERERNRERDRRREREDKDRDRDRGNRERDRDKDNRDRNRERDRERNKDRGDKVKDNGKRGRERDREDKNGADKQKEARDRNRSKERKKIPIDRNNKDQI